MNGVGENLCVRIPLGVIHLRTWRGLWRLPDLDRDAVISALSGLFGEVDGFDSAFDDVAVGRRSEREVVLTWRGERAKGDWSVYFRGRGVRHVGVIVDDARPTGPVEEYRAELPLLVQPLRQLAAATGARFFVAGADATDGSLDKVIDALL